ncbi:nucleotide exchange factor GrpE [Candidatus Dojkabacteria bacterium]|nr:nucleotide exchange factor GrpE [Candidatus Dojkabacteria bacterium]
MSKHEDEKTAKEYEENSPIKEVNEKSDTVDASKQNEEVENLSHLLEEEKEARLRALADFDNYKKRVAKERDEINLLGNSMILNTLLEIQDDLLKAIEEIENPPMGLKMINDKVKNFLNEQNIVEVEIKPDDKFDPTYMEAIGTITVNEEEKANKVIHVDRKAYKIQSRDMLLRTARVIVGKKG